MVSSSDSESESSLLLSAFFAGGTLVTGFLTAAGVCFLAGGSSSSLELSSLLDSLAAFLLGRLLAIGFLFLDAGDFSQSLYMSTRLAGLLSLSFSPVALLNSLAAPVNWLSRRKRSI